MRWKLAIPITVLCLTSGQMFSAHGSALADDGTNRYVATTGTDAANTCTDRDNPCRHIQYAVTVSNPGDTIFVAPGTYSEQVTIPQGDNNLRLVSERPWAAVIQAPPTIILSTPKAILRDNGAQDVGVFGFTISGPGPGPCDSIEYGVFIDNGGSAEVVGNHITKIEDTPFGGCQNGIGLEAGRMLTGHTGSVWAFGNLIDQYQKGGVVVDGSGSHGDIEGNRIVGAGPTPAIAQNGVQISRGADANVVENAVGQNVYSPQTVVSTGILTFQAGTVSLLGNRLNTNDIDVYNYGTNAAVIDRNDADSSTFAGITLDTSSNLHVHDNSTSGATAPGPGGTGGDGIELYTVTGSAVDGNGSFDNTADGIFVDSTSSGNTLDRNEMHHNGSFDAEDQSHGSGTAGTANTWRHNDCTSSSPPTLCQSDPDSAGHARLVRRAARAKGSTELGLVPFR